MASSYAAQDVPQFFKPFLHSNCSHSLQISSAFGNRYIESSVATRRSATITRPGTNQKWKVGLVEVDGEYYFNKGWKDFVKDNNMRDGEFMVFQYHRNCFFTVDIYGIHGCLKESVVEDQSIAEVQLIDLEDDDDDEGDDGQSRLRPGRPGGEDPSSKAVMAAKYYMKIHTEYASFRVSIGGGYIKHHLLNVPLSFVDVYMKGENKRAIKLKVKNKTWIVNMLVYRDSASPNCKLSKGVPAFINDNDIQEGDVCVFELVDRDNFNVAIFPN